MLPVYGKVRFVVNKDMINTRGGTIWNALRCALRIISGQNIYNFAILENLRIFQNCLFTGGVVVGNGICGAAFCESAALGEYPLRLTACALSVKAYGFASSPKGRAKSTAGSFLIMPNTLATGLPAWLSLRESWRGSA